jgi:hypothetical protein
MTPTEVITQARSKYNAVGDTFYSDAELLHLQYEGCTELAVDCDAIESTDATTTSTAGDNSYAFPTRCLSIKRLEYAGRKLKPLTQREDDTLTVGNNATTTTGTPQFYYIWDEVIYLRPVPAASSDTIKVYGFFAPDTVTASSTLEIPQWMHPGLVNFLLREMCAKDGNRSMAEYYGTLWEQHKQRIKKWRQKKKRGDSFSVVQDEEHLSEVTLGSI